MNVPFRVFVGPQLEFALSTLASAHDIWRHAREMVPDAKT